MMILGTDKNLTQDDLIKYVNVLILSVSCKEMFDCFKQQL